MSFSVPCDVATASNDLVHLGEGDLAPEERTEQAAEGLTRPALVVHQLDAAADGPIGTELISSVAGGEPHLWLHGEVVLE